MIRIGWAILVLYFFAGCNPTTPAPTDDGFSTQAVDPQTGVRIHTHIDADTIGIAERLRIEVRVEWVSPASVHLNEPNWEDTQWTRIDGTIHPVELSDDGFVLIGSFLLEPFLAGEYEVPVFEVVITPDTDSKTHTLLSMAMPVRVVSVLDTNDTGALEPAAGFLDPSISTDDQSQSNYGVLGILGLVLVVSGYTIWRLTKSNESNTGLSPYALFESVANGQDGTDSHAYETLYRAFTRLDPRLQQTSEVRGMIEQCERARFSATSTGTIDPVSMARHTLELLGGSETEGA